MNESNETQITIDDINAILLKGFAVNDYVLIGLYIPVIFFALSANLLFIIIVIKHGYMRRTSSYFLVNLSVADLFVTLICMPSAMWKAYTAVYTFGRYSCKIFSYIECVAVATSILTITTMAMHRCFAITKPLFGLMYPSFNRCGTVIVISCLWLTSMLIFSPALWIYDLRVDYFPMEEENITISFCVEEWTDIFISQHAMGIIWFIFIFLVPGLIMLVAYSTMGQTLCSDTQFSDSSTCTYQRGRLIRTRKKVACILLLLALIFAICWLPFHIMSLIDDTKKLQVDENDVLPTDESATQQQNHLNDIKRYLLLLGHLNSAINPILYITLSRNFRSSIKELFCRGSCESQREVTRATLIKLNTLRNPILQNSPSITQSTKKAEEANINHHNAR